jgi:uncharacterized membrane protein YcgQ (UPF0703/DUF1980 family)
VAVDPGAPREVSEDTWFEVNGELEEREGRLVVVAESLERVQEPKDPYLY